MKPLASNWPGTTRWLLMMSPVSVRRKSAPSSSIHSVAGKPKGTPHNSLKRRIISAFGSGFGAAKFTGPLNASCAITHSTAEQ